MDINAKWHATHSIRRYPTVEQRITWHLEHQKYCHCSPIPPAIMEEIQKRYVRVVKQSYF